MYATPARSGSSPLTAVLCLGLGLVGTACAGNGHAGDSGSWSPSGKVGTASPVMKPTTAAPTIGVTKAPTTEAKAPTTKAPTTATTKAPTSLASECTTLFQNLTTVCMNENLGVTPGCAPTCCSPTCANLLGSFGKKCGTEKMVCRMQLFGECLEHGNYSAAIKNLYQSPQFTGCPFFNVTSKKTMTPGCPDVGAANFDMGLSGGFNPAHVCQFNPPTSQTCGQRNSYTRAVNVTVTGANRHLIWQVQEYVKLGVFGIQEYSLGCGSMNQGQPCQQISQPNYNFQLCVHDDDVNQTLKLSTWSPTVTAQGTADVATGTVTVSVAGCHPYNGHSCQLAQVKASPTGAMAVLNYTRLIDQNCSKQYLNVIRDNPAAQAVSHGQSPASVRCTQEYQGALTSLMTNCNGKTVVVNGVTIPFDQNVVKVLQKNGPFNCDYSSGFEGCNSKCSIANIINWKSQSVLTANNCLATTSNGNWVYQSCSTECSATLSTLRADCSACEKNDPALQTFLQAASSYNSEQCPVASQSCVGVAQAITDNCCAPGAQRNSCEALTLTSSTGVSSKQYVPAAKECSKKCWATQKQQAQKCPAFFRYSSGSRYSYNHAFTSPNICHQGTVPAAHHASSGGNAGAPKHHSSHQHTHSVLWFILFSVAVGVLLMCILCLLCTKKWAAAEGVSTIIKTDTIYDDSTSYSDAPPSMTEW